MNRNLLDKMSSDMHIAPYLNENKESFACRVIYSALAEWMRFFVLDENETGIVLPKSKVYMLKRGQEIISSLLEVFPECKPWFIDKESQDNTYKEFVSSFRENMIQTGELICDDENHVHLPSLSFIAYGDDVDRVIGYLGKFTGIQAASGITRIAEQSDDNNSIIKREHIYETLDVYSFFDKACWTKCDSIEPYEFFIPQLKASLYNSWDRKPDNVSKFYLARIQIFNSINEFYILKRENTSWYVQRLNDVMVSMKEYRRIMLWLRNQAGNPMELYYTFHDNLVVINRFCRFPLNEESVMKAFGWPIGNDYADEMQFAVPIEIWPSISKIISGIDIEIKER